MSKSYRGVGGGRQAERQADKALTASYIKSKPLTAKDIKSFTPACLFCTGQAAGCAAQLANEHECTGQRSMH